ncbi:MAG: DUF362 domain-containing protein [Candidatus Altiarchaeota archaeon]
MASEVYFYSDVAKLREGTARFFKIAADDFKGGPVGLKVHFGEEGNKTHVKPEWLLDAKTILQTPIFVECNVMYRGHRTTRKDHIETARKHGFGFLPIDILDGETGQSYVDVPVNRGRTVNARLGGGLIEYKKLIAVTHFKGHMAASFGGALKNIGMGLGSRAGKMDMHSIIAPVVHSEKCTLCGTCARDCPVDAFTLGKVASIDSGKCIGCAHCIAICPNAAIDIPWNMTKDVNKILMEKVTEYAYAALSGRSWWFINFITDLTYDCDCMGFDQKPFMQDIGIVLSKDPVAADQASLDLVRERNGGVDPFLEKHKIDGTYMLEYAEKIGLGSRKYRIIAL